ncbi:hypothetical protein [Actinacidiphila glaucinigra]|uniref:hypothetical protein n=1 Tax=Actinacidiphila glaucinigra TaxID=235986 RepID=UPI0035D6472E
MARYPGRRPASAQTLYRALEQLGAAPRADPKLRPNGPTRSDTPLLLGILLAKAELDAALRADPAEEPPRGLTQFLAGYRSTVASTGDETRLRLLSLRLVRSAVEATLDAEPSRLAYAASDAALAAASLVDADRLQHNNASTTAIHSTLATAAQSLKAATRHLEAP